MTNAENGGIIKEQSKKPITEITDDAINRVPNVRILGYSDEQCDFIQQQHKELLKYARENNADKEVAFVFRSNLSDRSVFSGSDDQLEFGSALFGKGSDLFIMHNHPRNSSFSDVDLMLFKSLDSVKTLTIVKNNGTIEYITKSENYDRLTFELEYNRIKGKIVKNGTKDELNKFVKQLLSKTKSGVIWSGRE